jgi:hypothetical protein
MTTIRTIQRIVTWVLLSTRQSYPRPRPLIRRGEGRRCKPFVRSRRRCDCKRLGYARRAVRPQLGGRNRMVFLFRLETRGTACLPSRPRSKRPCPTGGRETQSTSVVEQCGSLSFVMTMRHSLPSWSLRRWPKEPGARLRGQGDLHQRRRLRPASLRTRKGWAAILLFGVGGKAPQGRGPAAQPPPWWQRTT